MRRLVPPGELRFKDLHGMDTLIEEIRPWTRMIQNTDEFVAHGVVIPRGIVLKESEASQTDDLIRAIADESGANVILPENVRIEESDVQLAREHQPAIIVLSKNYFINTYYEDGERISAFHKALNWIHEHERIWVIIRVNKKKQLDMKQLRVNLFLPGRFEQRFNVPAMSQPARLAFLKRNAPGVYSDDVLSYFSLVSDGMSPDALQIVMNQAAMRALSEGRTAVSTKDVVWATFPIYHGPCADIEIRDNMRMRAYHEAGHAIVFLFSELRDDWMFVTLVPRKDNGGFVAHQMCAWMEPLRVIKARIAMTMGGRVAEEIINGPDGVSAGAHSDIQVATKIARNMVMNHGMGPSGLILFEKEYPQIPESLKEAVHRDMQAILQEAISEARRILTEHRAGLDTVAHALMERMILTKDEILSILGSEHAMVTEKGCLHLGGGPARRKRRNRAWSYSKPILF